eukprot:Phypoly_transcript_00678.p1 GENE.Phypoly_transcript_00678~~Phypoly_transcript_00678.p1  ORF type:complete len:1395 (+),score=271.52 Phypoly_transcript_00678:28-4212(+)
MKKGRKPNAHGGKYNKPKPPKDEKEVSNPQSKKTQISELVQRQEDMLNYWSSGRTKDLPQVFVSADSQDLITDLLHGLKMNDSVNNTNLPSTSDFSLSSNPSIQKLQNELIGLGFRRDHVEQAIFFIAKDPRFPKLTKPNSNLAPKEYNEVLSSTLDWLCLHIQEVDLPRGFAPLNRIETVHFATPSRPTYEKSKAEGDQTTNEPPTNSFDFDEMAENLSMVQSYFLIKMSNYGFTRKSSLDALNMANQNEDEALWILLQKIKKDISSANPTDQADPSFVPDEAELITQREEERLVLESIFGSDFEPRNSMSSVVKLHMDELLSSSAVSSDAGSAQLEIYFPPGCQYPYNYDPPVILFLAKSLLGRMNYELSIQLSTQALRIIRGIEDGGGLGPTEPHVILYDLVLWAQAQLPAVIEKISIKNTPKIVEPAPVPVAPPKRTLTAVDFTLAKLETKQMQEELEEKKRAAREAYLQQLIEADQNPGMKVEKPNFDFEPKKEVVVEPKKEEDEVVEAIINSEELQLKENKEQEQLEKQNKMRLQKLIKEMKIKEKLGMENSANESAKLKEDFERRMKLPEFNKILSKRTQLPAFQMREEVLQTIRNNQVVVITGETGCGKTTQVPQFVMDDMILSGKGAQCNMIITQPRRISAMSVADRIAEERSVKVGQEVGYQIRLEAKRTNKTRLLLCTTGIVLRKMQGHSKLEGISHLVVDEVHERNLDDDFLLIILRDLLPSRPDLKVILMSATLNAELFAAYFGNCPMLHIPGRAYPVKELFLEDVLETTKFFIHEDSPYSKKSQKTRAEKKGQLGGNKAAKRTMMNLDIDEKVNEMLTLDAMATIYPGKSKATLQSLINYEESKINPDLVENLVAYICEQALSTESNFMGSILVFLPGIMEISTLYNSIRHNRSMFPESKYLVLPLHSSLSSADQRKVFERPPPGVRKIVLSTNIAETSVTIDDVVYVVDCGRMKENRYDPVNRMPQLVEVWESKANARQRKGRAGRVQEGICYRMYTSQRHTKLQDYQVPEMHRVPLEELCLQIKILDLGEISSFLSKAIEPPEAQAIGNAITSLEELDALDKLQFLTPLGYHLAQLPVDVRLGKMMLYGTIFRCLEPVLIIAAAMSTRDPFVSPSLEKRNEVDKVKKSFAVGKSDHLTLLKAYRGWQNARAEKTDQVYCQKFFLDSNTLRNIYDMKRQFVELLSEIGFMPPHLLETSKDKSKNISGGEYFNTNAESIKLIKAVLCAGLYPNVLRVVPSPTPSSSYSTPTPPKLRTRTGEEVSIHPVSVNFEQPTFESNYLIFHEKVKSTKVYIRDSTMITPYPLLLFGGEIAVHHARQIISVDRWIEFACPAKTAVLFKLLRTELDKLLVLKIENPNLDISTGKTIDAIIQLLDSEFV